MAERWFETTHKLRYNDCDPAGHVNNAVYSTMAEAGRTDLLLASGVLRPDAPYAMVIVRLEIDFKAEMHWPGDVLIQTAVARFGAKSIHMRQAIHANGKDCAHALSVLAAIDKATRRAILLDDHWRASFAPWTLPA